MSRLPGTPLRDGFRMPAEFERHEWAWMQWPERTDIWPYGAKPAQRAFALLAEKLSTFEPVTMCVSHGQYANARARLDPAVRVVELSYDGCWIRDTGPVYVVNERGVLRSVQWKFNAWGGLDHGLYFPWDKDQAVATKLSEFEGVNHYFANHVLEGGAIVSDGDGTLLTTEECILDPNRNPALDRERATAVLRDFLGVTTVIWLPVGLKMDEAGGHIDNLCCFASPGEVFLAWTDDTQHMQYESVRRAYECLAGARDARGRKFEICKMPLPAPLRITAEESRSIDIIATTVGRVTDALLIASYVNSYIGNGVVLVPQFGQDTDTHALKTMEGLFRGREIVGFEARPLLLGGGNIHCNIRERPCGSGEMWPLRNQ